MPSRREDVQQFFERLTALEERVSNLVTFQKWEMAILATILAAVIIKRL